MLFNFRLPRSRLQRLWLMSCTVIISRKRRPDLESDVGGDRNVSAAVAAASISIPGSTARVRRLTTRCRVSWAQIAISKRRTWSQDESPWSGGVNQRDGERHEAAEAAKRQCFSDSASVDLVPLWNKNVPLQSQFNQNLFRSEPYFLFILQNVVKQNQTDHSTVSSFSCSLWKCCTAKLLL